MKIEIKSIFGSVLFEYECENNTIRKTLENAIKEKADLSYADLRSANLRYADLRSAYLSNADLSYAYLRNADLRNADLRNADLSYADLRYADLRNADLSNAYLSNADLSNAYLSKRYIQVACIGSRKGMTTYCFDDDIIWCGCFIGTLKEFAKKVKETHKDNEVYLKEYLGLIKYIKSLK